MEVSLRCVLYKVFGAAPVVLVGALLRDLFCKRRTFTCYVNGYVSTNDSAIACTNRWWLYRILLPLACYFLRYFFNGIFICFIGLFNHSRNSSKRKSDPLRLSLLLRNFVILCEKSDWIYVHGSFGFGGLFAFITTGSIVYIGIYGVPVQNFGYFFMINIIIFLTLGTLLNGRFVSKIGTERMLQIGLTIPIYRWNLVIFNRSF